MFGFGNDTTKQLFAALIDISSDSVGVAIVAISQESKLPTLLYSYRTHMRITNFDSVKSDNLRRVREALFSACLLLSQEGYLKLQSHNARGKVSKVFVTCSSPWSYTLAQNVKYENDIRFKVNQNIIDDLIQSAVLEISNHLKESGLLSKEGFETVEQVTMNVQLNDYPVAEPIGLSGTSVSLSHIVGLVPKEISSSLQEVKEKLFRNSESRIHTYILVMFCVIQDLFKKVHSMCIINVTGEATEFGIAENGLLIENSFVPSGYNTFTRSIMQKTGKPQSDVVTLMQAYKDGSHTPVGLLDDYIDDFSNIVADNFRKILERRVIPNEIFITVHTPHEKLFRDIIETALKKVSLPKRHLVLIDANIINQISDGDNEDIPLSLGARFFHTLHSYPDTTKN